MEKPKRDHKIELEVPLPAAQCVRQLKNIGGDFDCIFTELGFNSWQFTLRLWNGKPIGGQYSRVKFQLTGLLKGVDENHTLVTILKGEPIGFSRINQRYYNSLHVQEELVQLIKHSLMPHAFEVPFMTRLEDFREQSPFIVAPPFYFIVPLPMKVCVEMLENLADENLAVSLNFEDDFTCKFSILHASRYGVSISGTISESDDETSEILGHRDRLPLHTATWPTLILLIIIFGLMSINEIGMIIAFPFMLVFMAWLAWQSRQQNQLISKVDAVFGYYKAKNKIITRQVNG